MIWGKESVINVEIPQSHIKLATTATGGADAEHSPYYRRLLSAGYKGFIQGSIGGGALYGGFGAVVGTAVGFTMLFTSGLGLASFVAIPLFAGLGIMKGANAFGQIGSTAAIFAEGAEMRERRGALLDRLHVTESQKEADEIIKTLHEEAQEKPLQKIFHLKTMIIGAVIGAAMLSLISLALPHVLIGAIKTEAATGIASKLLTAIVNNPFLTGVVSAVIGAVGGATIGIDRGYIRRWFDLSENIVYDQTESMERARQRQREAGRLSRIAEGETPKKEDISGQTVTFKEAAPKESAILLHHQNEVPPPKVKVHTANLEHAPLMKYEQAMRTPVV